MRIAVLALALAVLPTRSEAARVVTHDFKSESLAGNRMHISNIRRISVLIPDACDRPKMRCPVTYYIPGFGGGFSRGTFLGRLGDAVETSSPPPALVVLMDMEEGIVPLNSEEFGRWSDFLFDELIPFIDRTYRTIRSPAGRAVIGASIGGLSAVVWSAQRPGVWGAIGLNDGAAYHAGYYELHADRPDQLPAGLRPDFQLVMNAWKNLPRSLDAYASLKDLETRVAVQLGLAISPNPDAPLRFDPPIDREGHPVPAVLDKWRAYCFFDPTTIVRNRSALGRLTRIALVVPHFDDTTNSYQNTYWMDLMTAAGLPVTRIDMPGGHSDFAIERFIALERVLLTGARGK